MTCIKLCYLAYKQKKLCCLAIWSISLILFMRKKEEKEKEMTINAKLEVMKPHVLARDRGVDEKIHLTMLKKYVQTNFPQSIL